MKRKLIRAANDPWLKGKCHIKARYGSERDARRVGRDRLANPEPSRLHGGEKTDRLWPYACCGCRQWHLTRQDSGEVAITRREMWEGTGL